MSKTRSPRAQTNRAGSLHRGLCSGRMARFALHRQDGSALRRDGHSGTVSSGTLLSRQDLGSTECRNGSSSTALKGLLGGIKEIVASKPLTLQRGDDLQFRWCHAEAIRAKVRIGNPSRKQRSPVAIPCYVSLTVLPKNALVRKSPFFDSYLPKELLTVEYSKRTPRPKCRHLSILKKVLHAVTKAEETQRRNKEALCK